MTTARSFAVLIFVLSFVPPPALAWGTAGHAMIGRLGAQAFPSDMPAFTRSAAAIDEIATLGPEEDVLKGSGRSWDADNDPGHFLDVGDDGTVDGLQLNAFPQSMAAYASALSNSGATPWSVGYLFYSIADGFEQLREDFAWWRADVHDANARRLREALTLRDIGVWSHFVGDGSQPLHVTTHFNGWARYTNAPIHSLFETDFVNKYVTAADVRAHVMPENIPPVSALLGQTQIDALVGAYLTQSNAQVVPLYELAGPDAAGFRRYSVRAVAFTAAQLARGSAELRDLTDLAWRDSAYASVGYPPHPVPHP